MRAVQTVGPASVTARRTYQGLWAVHPRVTVAAWFAIAVALGAMGFFFGMLTVAPGPSSKQVIFAEPGEQLAYQAGIPPHDTLFVLLSSPTLDSDSTDFVRARDSLVAKLRGTVEPGAQLPVFEKVETVGRTQLDDSLFVSENRHHVLIVATTIASIDRAMEVLVDVPEIIRGARQEHPGIEISYLSHGTGDKELFDLIDRDLDQSLIYTLPITLAILLWAFGSVVAAALPLLIAVVSLIGSLGTAALLSHVFGAVNVTASQLVVLLVLALGVDYSLFILTRVREEKAAGRGSYDAIDASCRSAGRSVIWSGVTVALSLFGLFLMNDTVLCSMALVSIVAVILTLIGSVYVLPALLFLCDRWITPAREPSERGGYWARFLSLSIRRPALVLGLWGAGILALGGTGFLMRLGSTVEPGLLPRSLESRRGFDRLTEQFSRYSGTDFSLIVRGERLDGLEFDERMQDFLDDLQQDHDAVRGPIDIDRSSDGTLARYSFVAVGSPNSSEVQRVISDLRERLIPAHFSTGAVSVTGTLPFIVDQSRLYQDRTPVVFGVVLVLSMLFLLLAFRSVVIPVKAILLNTLSAAASFGTLVLVFQRIPGSPWHYEVVESFVPALLFSILFGLSMDYHLLLLSRIREELDRGYSNHEAVQRGINATAGAITSAALIMVSVFAVVASLELPVMKELGLGLAVAVLLDATVIRTLLLPASMVLLGDWNWYLPSWLEWLPRGAHSASERVEE
ncbi:MAG: MMPL family transporter [Bdellovibrionota bacterium]